MGISKNWGFSPQIIHFYRVFHEINHPVWGKIPYFWVNTHMVIHYSNLQGSDHPWLAQDPSNKPLLNLSAKSSSQNCHGFYRHRPLQDCRTACISVVSVSWQTDCTQQQVSMPILVISCTFHIELSTCIVDSHLVQLSWRWQYFILRWHVILLSWRSSFGKLPFCASRFTNAMEDWQESSIRQRATKATCKCMMVYVSVSTCDSPKNHNQV